MEVSPAVQQRISTALTQFRTQMLASNRRYITNLLFVANCLPSKRRMRNFAASIRYGGPFPTSFKTPEQVIADPPEAAKWKLEHDGTWPPKSDHEITQFLEALEEKIKATFEQDDEKKEDVHVPEEYRALLGMCDGIWDVDFRRSGCVGIQGTNCIGDGVVGKNEPFQQIDKSQEQDHGWEIATGWCLDGNETVSHYYFCCQRTSEGRGGPVQESEKEWKWRLFYRDLDSSEDATFRVFHSIPEFLSWFGNWYARDVEGEGNEGGDGDMEPESPYEAGVDYEDEDDEENEAKEMQEYYLQEAARQGHF
ncbi:uncharacterized protein RCO7_03530 [Rhynchosporium graminicola]|uniref:Uncharacterized protein n=1 Tax=Rhynchosporium graminicola TaxID=2792576 RepID=A0A1E1LK89_9HELO|nr:uncharacterized protein RCO7_03530 [Rhynchosporium commune]